MFMSTSGRGPRVNGADNEGSEGLGSEPKPKPECRGNNAGGDGAVVVGGSAMTKERRKNVNDHADEHVLVKAGGLTTSRSLHLLVLAMLRCTLQNGEELKSWRVESWMGMRKGILPPIQSEIYSKSSKIRYPQIQKPPHPGADVLLEKREEKVVGVRVSCPLPERGAGMMQCNARGERERVSWVTS